MNDLIKIHIADATGSLAKHSSAITEAFSESIGLMPKEFVTEGVDVVFQDLPTWVIPEMGIGGRTYSGHLIDISLDSSHEIKKSDLIKTLVHELHHAVRWQKVSFNSTLGELLVSEGLACLFEEELTGTAPIYVQGEVDPEIINAIRVELDKNSYDSGKWFYGSTEAVPRWFGYTYGYNLCKTYSKKHNLTTSTMVDLKAEAILS